MLENICKVCLDGCGSGACSGQSPSCNIPIKVEPKIGLTQGKNRCLITHYLATMRRMGNDVGLENMH